MAGSGRERASSSESQRGTGYRLKAIVKDGWICTFYDPTDPSCGFDRALRYADFGIAEVPDRIVYDGTEGELYMLDEEAHQWVNRWDDLTVRDVRDASSLTSAPT